MKTLRFFLLTLSSLILFGCENGDNNALPSKPDDNECYKGTMTVDQNDGTFYTQEDVEVDYEILDDKLNFVMYKVKFAEAMPIKLDMVVEGVDCLGAVGNYVLAGNNIVPYAMGGPFEKFTITNLNGLITNNTMTLSFMCGEHQVTYNSTK
ncbi:MAG: hypothetical protein J6V26_00300 [Alistipes sp.]|nr:hypothetical protein [Alistipes sp.]